MTAELTSVVALADFIHRIFVTPGITRFDLDPWGAPPVVGIGDKKKGTLGCFCLSIAIITTCG